MSKQEESVIQSSDKITAEFIDRNNVGFLVSYGYRHILKADVLGKLPRKAVNLHISYLPWNRGADPNFWSFVEDTPKGVTIHYLDEGIDTGDIIAQRKVAFSETDTLRTSYDRLQAEIQALFKENWLDIRAGRCNRKQQEGKGTYHRLKDKEGFSHLLTNGWDTPITTLEAYAAETQMSMQFWEKYDAEIEAIRKQDQS